MYNYSFSEELSQGDILRRVRVMSNIVGGENGGPKFREGTLIVITRNCEIDKPLTASNSVLVARIIRLSSQSEKMQGYIRDNNILNAFYLPSGNQLTEEYYIDWRTLQPISKEIMCHLRKQEEHYLCTLNRKMMIAALIGLRDFNAPEDDEDE